jgi:hypothetical protein
MENVVMGIKNVQPNAKNNPSPFLNQPSKLSIRNHFSMKFSSIKK